MEIEKYRQNSGTGQRQTDGRKVKLHPASDDNGPHPTLKGARLEILILIFSFFNSMNFFFSDLLKADLQLPCQQHLSHQIVPTTVQCVVKLQTVE